MKTCHVPTANRLLFAACAAILISQSSTFGVPVVDLRFNEGSGNTTINAGTSGGLGTFAEQNGAPFFSNNIPTGAFAPAGNVSAIDFGPIVTGDGGRAIDFPASTAAPTFGLSAFTVTGWLNLRSSQIGPGGNRILTTWPGEMGSDRGGFEVVQESNGRLRFSVNEAPDFPGPGPFSSIGRLTIDPLTAPGNWLFFAVTYNAGDLGNTGDGVVNFYFGNASTLATLDTMAFYDRGSILNVPVGKSGTMTAGNFTTDVVARFATGSASRVIRGLVDELSFHDAELNQSQIQAVQVIPEPGSALLLTLGLAGMIARRSRAQCRVSGNRD